MEYSSYHHPYSHRTRFKVVRSTTKLVKQPKTTSQFKLIRNDIKTPKPTIIRTKSVDKSSTIVAKNIGNKYKWIRTSLKKIESNRLVRNITKHKGIEPVGVGSEIFRHQFINFEILFSFKFDRRKILSPSITNGRIAKRKARASLSKCLVRIRGVKFHTNPNGKCLQRLSKIEI